VILFKAVFTEASDERVVIAESLNKLNVHDGALARIAVLQTEAATLTIANEICLGRARTATVDTD